MQLKTERLTIRRIAGEDWESIRRIWKDFSASEYAQYDTPHDTDAEAVRARIGKWAKHNTGTDHMFFAVCLDDTLIGYIAFNVRAGSHEIGYCFHSDYHGYGYAKESHMALFDYLSTLGITKFTAGTALDNLPSVKLLTRLGFEKVSEETVCFYEGHPFRGGTFVKTSFSSGRCRD